MHDILTLPRPIQAGGAAFYTIVPKSSVVGMLLEHEEDYTVVDSSQQGLMQHDGFSWEVRGDRIRVTLHSSNAAGAAHGSGAACVDSGHDAVPAGAVCRRACFAVLTASGARDADRFEGRALQGGGRHGARHEAAG